MDKSLHNPGRRCRRRLEKQSQAVRYLLQLQMPAGMDAESKRLSQELATVVHINHWTSLSATCPKTTHGGLHG